MSMNMEPASDELYTATKAAHEGFLTDPNPVVSDTALAVSWIPAWVESLESGPPDGPAPGPMALSQMIHSVCTSTGSRTGLLPMVMSLPRTKQTNVLRDYAYLAGYSSSSGPAGLREDMSEWGWGPQCYDRRPERAPVLRRVFVGMVALMGAVREIMGPRTAYAIRDLEARASLVPSTFERLREDTLIHVSSPSENSRHVLRESIQKFSGAPPEVVALGTMQIPERRAVRLDRCHYASTFPGHSSLLGMYDLAQHHLACAKKVASGEGDLTEDVSVLTDPEAQFMYRSYMKSALWHLSRSRGNPRLWL